MNDEDRLRAYREAVSVEMYRLQLHEPYELTAQQSSALVWETLPVRTEGRDKIPYQEAGYNGNRP